MSRLLAAGATHVGLWRSNNEDAYIIAPEAGFFAISDGMGGAAAGEVASRYFIDTAQALLSNRAVTPRENDYNLIRKVFGEANTRIIEHVARHPEDKGMGCTGDLLVFNGYRYVIGHVGDSSVYLVRDKRLKQLTTDHSLVQSLVDEGILTPEDARHHPRKNILIRAVGTDPSVSCDILEGIGHNQGIFLLCTDGLMDMVDDLAIKDVLTSKESLRQKVDTLIAEALAAGGRDNITVILCEIEMA